uniref:Uncharacterized protein n=1 Tax=Curvibacter symbiont subsp. Hydra magnipapillata TaxID=667019 RepID=C9Y906_CURXX|nr:hypothetical protein Csp_A06070 [Curvibacter putative symbiont of Hydra magnipapillata]
MVAATSTVYLACSSAQEPQQMFDKASALTKLTAHVDAAVLYSPTGKSESDKTLLDKAFADNPTLKQQLGIDMLLLQRGEKGVVVLLCTEGGAKALLEDLSCTSGMDKHHWRDEPDRICAFSLNPAGCP